MSTGGDLRNDGHHRHRRRRSGSATGGAAWAGSTDPPLAPAAAQLDRLHFPAGWGDWAAVPARG
ncbi:hypothetical protein ABZZ20_30965 [Streptomyces sp. NPDC006430]|uniref:hypothetical protein n=1 Tax=Streptomyces sp. NPDC006430 TaxID=3154299 RepID=UPI0033AC5B8F